MALPLFCSFFTQSMFSQFYPPASTFAPERDIPDQSGKVVLVTGGNSGVGYETVKHLLLKSARVYLAARDPVRARDAANRLKSETDGREPVVLELDLADLTSVRRAAEEFLSKETALHTLYNNAGAVWVPVEMVTKQGYDLAFGTNVLGHFFLTILLMPALAQARVKTGHRARIINVSSSSHVPTLSPEAVDYYTLVSGPGRDQAATKHGSYALYAQSKMGVILLSHLLHRHFSDKVISISINPGNFNSSAYRYVENTTMYVINRVLYTVPQGALTQLHAGTADGEFEGGEYLIPWARRGVPDPRTKVVAYQDKLWDWLNEQVKSF